MRYEAIHSFVMLRGAKCDESLLRLRTAASSPAVRRTVPIPEVWLAAVEGRPITNRRSRLGRCAIVITSAATVWQDYLPSISPRSGIKRYVQRVLVLDAGNASVHAACSLTASESCI